MKITSDGTIPGTVITTDDGHRIDGVVGLVISGSGSDKFLIAHMTVRLSSLNIVIDDNRIRVVAVDEDGMIQDLREIKFAKDE